MTTGFVIFYLCLLGFFLNNAIKPVIEFTVCALMLGGGLFVSLTARLSQRSLAFCTKQKNEAEFASRHDELTNLPNRRLFLEDIQALINTNSPFALLVLDLNKFKQVNDALGHLRGDQLLHSVACRLLDSLTNQRKVYRLGGDEFAIIDKQASHGMEAAHSVAQQLEKPIALGDMSIDLGASIGVALYPDNGNDEISLLSRADMAMFQAKRLGTKVCLFEEQLDINLKRKHQISSQLRTAVASDQLHLYYQPVYASDGKRIASVEALLRWPIRNGEFISPEEFIPIAEEERQVGAITNWVLDTSTKQLAQWHALGYDINLNVNLSTLDLQDPLLWPRIESMLKKNAIEASKMVFEITEGAMLNNVDTALMNLSRLNQGGCRIAIDDFGTGYSSLSRLKSMPIHQIKVDRCFVMDIQNNAQDESIVRAAVYLARTLNCTVTAEGVETARAVDLLKSMGCDHLQGFHLGRPMPEAPLTELLASNYSQGQYRQTGS